MSSSVVEIRARILEVQSNLHGAGTVSAQALDAIVQHASTRVIKHSVETGCGATTLLFSHLSQCHTVFALDFGASVVNVRRSSLLREGIVTFIEGPSQRTLPQYRFTEKLQLVLIDGPHAYPFPDLEYYFLYPHLDVGALLILDDIQIRSIHNLFTFLQRDEMFQLDQVVRNTAFFTRTDAPTFDPLGDGWRQQKYNEQTLLRYDWRSRIARSLPRLMLRELSTIRQRFAHRDYRVKILNPGVMQSVDETGITEGTASLNMDGYLWVLVHRTDVDGWWPQSGGSVAVAHGRWKVEVSYGGPHDAGRNFEIVAVIVRRGIHELWLDWTEAVKNTGLFPPVQLPQPKHVFAETYCRVRREIVVR